jgi:exosortase/archaeosortase family protein
MFKYIRNYIFVGSILFGLLYIENISPFFFLNDLQTDFTLVLISYSIEFLRLPIEMQEAIMIFDNGAKIIIHYTCNAMTAILLYSAAIISYPTAIKNKFLWFVGGYIVIVAINLLRILLVSYAVTIDPNYFNWSHDYIGRYGMGILTLYFFFIFTQYVKLNKRAM